MPLPIVTQLRFARTEFLRCLDGVPPDDAIRRLPPMNSISWIVGHLASQEQFLWVEVAQGELVAPGLHTRVGFGSPASAPDWDEMWALWQAITQAADPFLDSLTPELLDTRPVWQERTLDETYGSLLLRNIYHYWFHTGEAHAIRQMLGHADLPQFVGDVSSVRY